MRLLRLLTIVVAGAFLTGCSADKAAAPPKPGTIAYSWHAAGETWKTGDYERSMEHLSRVAANQNEYRDKARLWLAVVSAGVADGYLELSNAYDDAARTNKAAAADYRARMRDIRKIADSAALTYAQTVHEFLPEYKAADFQFEFAFPAGELREPIQLARIQKGLGMQGADHEVARKAMAQRGVARFAALIAGSPTDLEKARAQFAKPPRDAALAGFAGTLITVADLYCPRKLDLPRRGNALCKEALDAIAMMPEGKVKKELEGKAKKEMTRYKIT